MKVNQFLILAFSVMLAMACKKEGCTDQTASNYNSKAKNDDGSCVYDGTGGGGSGGTNDFQNLAGNTSSPITISNIVSSSTAYDYYIDGTWSINAAVTIEPGVRILMKSGAKISVNENGSLNAVGTSANKIAFIGEESLEGYWENIRFNQSNKTNNELTHVEIKYAGGNINSFQDASVFLNGNARLKMNNSLIQSSQWYGLKVRSADGNIDEFSNNTISQGMSHPVYFNNIGQFENFAGNNNLSSGNEFNTLFVDGGNVEFSKNMPFVNATILLRGTSVINAAVTIAAGNNFEMGSGARIEVDVNGSLSMIGTTSEHITFTGEEQLAGYWENIRFDDSQSPDNEMQYVDISYGGGSSNSFQDASVFINNSAYLKMGNSSVNHSQRHGVKVKSVDGTFDDQGNNSFSNNGLDDINLP
jgi:hypothetical protein